jgi:hypothetical protein
MILVRSSTGSEASAVPLCPNCKKTLECEQEVRYGFHEHVIGKEVGRSLCPLCKAGCYEWMEDERPGLGLNEVRACCKCGKRP